MVICIGTLYKNLMKGCGYVAALIYACIALVISVDILLRNVLVTLNIPWALEGSEYMLGLATFIAAPWGLYVHTHVRIDVLIQVVNQKIGLLLDLISNCVGSVVCLILFIVSIYVMLQSKSHGNMIVKTLVFPEWWQYLPVVFCFGLLTVEFIRRIFCSKQIQQPVKEQM